jgi:nicotinate dehydrogenase subunit A
MTAFGHDDIRIGVTAFMSHSSTALRIRVNGTAHDVSAEPDTPLLYVLRNELSLNGPKFGCGLGQCGACTVHVDGAPRRSCVTAVSAVAGKDVVTLEGLGTPERPHPLQQAFIDEQAAQCGYCINGMIMRAAALLARTPRPSRNEVLSAMDANLCRCGTHMRILRAIERAAAGGATRPAGREG